MYLVVGLGNPEPEYSMTRHNMGFDVINKLAKKYNISVEKKGFDALYGSGMIENEKVILCKPQTYMNLSGDSVIQFINYYKIDMQDVIIIYDDISLPLGKLRIREKGSAGGHNGMKSIIYQLGSDVFPRIKIGVGAPQNEGYDLADYVLGHFSKEEVKILTETVIRAADAVECIITDSAQRAMSKFNG